jgi:hypothetical protein
MAMLISEIFKNCPLQIFTQLSSHDSAELIKQVQGGFSGGLLWNSKETSGFI